MLSDWSSIFQLLCAYTLIVGGYVQYKAHTEGAVEQMLKDAADAMSRVKTRKECLGLSIGSKTKVLRFEWIKEWHELSTNQLNAHRKFLTSWYWERKLLTRVADRRRNIALNWIGAVAFLLLLASAAVGDLKLSPYVGIAISLALWTPVFFIMINTWHEDAELQELSQYTAKPNTLANKFSTKPFPGMIYAVTNHVRRHEVESGKIVAPKNLPPRLLPA